MNYIIILGTTLLLTLALWFISRKTKINLNKILKVLAVVLFGTYMIRLFSSDAVDSVFNLLLVDIDTQINAVNTWLLSVDMSIFMLMLRWMTIGSMIFVILSPYFKLKNTKIIASLFAFVVGILNIIFINQNFILFFGAGEQITYRVIEFYAEIILILTVSSLTFLHYIKEYGWMKLKDLSAPLGIFAVSLVAVLPQSFLYNVIGNYGEIPEDFDATHIMLLIVPVLLMILSYVFLNKKTQEQKDFFVTFLAFAAFFQFFYVRRYGIGGLPLHLCNTAIILMLLAIVFRLKEFFYFNFFANVLGALAALLFPDISGDIFSLGAMQYAFNHWYAFAWPIIAISLHTFERPVLKHMYKALVVFSIYYVSVVFLNAWFNNYSSTDYFFTYGNHITDMLGLTGLQYNHVVSFTYNDLTFTFFWLYQIIFFFAFIFMMFMSWYVYDAFFLFADQQGLLHEKQKKMKLDELRLYELLDGRDPSEPINMEGIDMIKISHFSKRYGNSNKYAVKDFSLEVHKGEVFGFLGHNGAGKSTTIKSLVGIQSITEGEMEICGYSIKSQPLEAKLQIGYVSDNHAVYEKLTGREYIEYVADLYKVEPALREERLMKLLDEFNLAYAIDQEIKSYSHGMKQKLVVIAALIHEPPVWILDEPLTGLDPTSAFQIKESMREHAAKGNIVFFSSHVIEVVEKVCNRIAIITHGELQGVYDMDEIRAKGISLEELYMSKIIKKKASE